MKAPLFDWDRKKALLNQLKHKGLSFGEAVTVFKDENAIEAFDPDHSEDEERFLMIGMSEKMRILVVAYCYQADDEVIRIFSARKATKKEVSFYTSGGQL